MQLRCFAKYRTNVILCKVFGFWGLGDIVQFTSQKYSRSSPLFLVCMVPLCWRARFIVTHQTGLSNHRVSHAYWLHKKVICGMNGKITQILIYSFYLCPQIDVLYTRTHLEQARALWIISFLWKSKWKCNFTAKTNEPNWEPIPVKWTEHWRCFQDPYAWVGMIKHISNSISLYPCGQE